MKALRFSGELVISENVCWVGPGSVNWNPPIPSHFETLPGKAKNFL
jgi:hypothetical protein